MVGLLARIKNTKRELSIRGFTDSGGASRFFYVAKASKRDRNEGLDELASNYAQGLGSPRKGNSPTQQ
jgi:hypothetical protein